MAQVGAKLTAEEAMRLAIAEARKGVGFVSPNPLVGCVIVDRDHRFLAIGYHRAVGQAHAEVDALQKVTDAKALEGATCYVTLEPCAHEGRTPSCAKAMAKLPFRRVVYGLEDPNPLVAGQGAAILREAGIEALEISSCTDLPAQTRKELIGELEDLAEVFLHNMRAKSPFVALKVATSLDGMMAMDSGESKWITSEESRQHAHYLRAHYDAVLIGRKTLEQDDPQLNVRLPGFENHSNRVVILDPSGSTLAGLSTRKLVMIRKPENVFVVVDSRRSPIQSDEVRADGIKMIALETDGSGFFCVNELLRALWEERIMSIFLEGGARTFSQFLDHGCVQRLHLFMAPILLGGRHGVNWMRDCGGPQMSSRFQLKRMQQRGFGPDLYLTGRL